MSAISVLTSSVNSIAYMIKLFFSENFKGDDFLSGTQTVLELNHFLKKEVHL
jgi:hypothetical protein